MGRRLFLYNYYLCPSSPSTKGYCVQTFKEFLVKAGLLHTKEEEEEESLKCGVGRTTVDGVERNLDHSEVKNQPTAFDSSPQVCVIKGLRIHVILRI